MLQMFCAGPRTWLGNSCALGNKRMLQKMWDNSDSCITVSYSKTILPQWVVYRRAPKGRRQDFYTFGLINCIYLLTNS